MAVLRLTGRLALRRWWRLGEVGRASGPDEETPAEPGSGSDSVAQRVKGSDSSKREPVNLQRASSGADPALGTWGTFSPFNNFKT